MIGKDLLNFFALRTSFSEKNDALLCMVDLYELVRDTLPHWPESMFHLRESFLSLLFDRVSVNTILLDDSSKGRCYICLHDNCSGSVSILILTRSVPRTVWDCASRMLLHAKHVSSWHSLPDSWASHRLSGGWTEFAVSPDMNITHVTYCKEINKRWDSDKNHNSSELAHNVFKTGLNIQGMGQGTYLLCLVKSKYA